ncbi:MAG: disulfide bond formation protein B [Qingshengfaniella sp.]
MSGRVLSLLATAGSLTLLLGALAFQYIGGLPPCDLCIDQRWPHLAAVVFGLIGRVLRPAAMAALGALATLSTAGIGAYHAGVEYGWWPGPDSCTGSPGGLGGLSGADLLSTDTVAPIVMCDQVAWSLMGLSMAGWNAVLSFALTGLWIMAYRRLNER